MESKSEILSGGNMNQVVKIGDTVHRKVKGDSMLHSYLLYLEEAGMPGVPRFRGMDEQGREILTFLHGKTMGPDYPAFHPCLNSDETVRDMGQFMRKLHDISIGFLPKAIENNWKSPNFPQEKWETICHNDTAIWNFVFANDHLTGLFDFDSACPGTRIWDLATSLYSVIPLTAHVPVPELLTSVSYEPSQHAAERKRRIKIFFDAYGMDCPPDLMDWVILRIQKDFCDDISKGAAAGDENCIRMVNEGHLAYYQSVVSFLKIHGQDWM